MNEDSELYPGEGTQGRIALQWNLGQFFSPLNWDSFRIDWIEVTARLRTMDLESNNDLSNLFQGVDVFSSFDPDDYAVTFEPTDSNPDPNLPVPLEWKQWKERPNIGRVTLTPQDPARIVMRIKPAALNFRSAASLFPSVAAVWDPQTFYNSGKATGRDGLRFGSVQIFCHANNYNREGNKPFTVDLFAEAGFTLKHGI